MKKLLVLSVAVLLMAGGCQKNSVAPTSDSTGSVPANKGYKNTQTASAKPSFVPVSKNCDVPPPSLSQATTTNASGQTINTKQDKIYTSRQAIPMLWAKAKEWAPDAKLALGFDGAGQSMMMQDAKYRLHAG